MGDGEKPKAEGRVLSLDQIRSIISSAALDQLVGVLETSTFEAKGQPYFANKGLSGEQLMLQENELAKDVSALINSGGGIILIGAATASLGSSQRDVVVSVKGFPPELFDEDQYRTTLRRLLIPKVDHIEIAEISCGGSPRRICVAIEVSQLENEQLPCIVARPEGSGRVKGNYVGVFERVDDKIEHFDSNRIHNLLRMGLDLTPINSKLDRILTESQDHKNKSQAFPTGDLGTRVETAISETELVGSSFILYIAHPTTIANLPGLFRSRKDPVVELISNPPFLREDGFGLPRVGHNGPEPVDGTRQQVVSNFGRGLFVWNDGLVVFAADAGPNFLCWSSRQDRTINPLVLTESLYVFIDFVKRLYLELAPSPTGISFSLRIMHGEGEAPLKMYSGPLIDGAVFLDGHVAKNSAFDSSVIASAADDSGKTAYLLLARLYAWFDFYEDAIPYAEDNRIRADLITAGRT